MFPFSLPNINSLRSVLMRPIRGLNYERLQHGPVVDVGIVFVDGSHLTITNTMNDLEPRGEMGSLSFLLERRNFTVGNLIKLHGFRHIHSVKKLVAVDEEYEAESGIVITGGEGDTLMIASAVYPYSLYVSCSEIEVEGNREYYDNNCRFEDI